MKFAMNFCLWCGIIGLIVNFAFNASAGKPLADCSSVSFLIFWAVGVLGLTQCDILNDILKKLDEKVDKT